MKRTILLAIFSYFILSVGCKSNSKETNSKTDTIADYIKIVNQKVQAIEEKTKNIEPQKFDTGTPDPSDETSHFFYYYYLDNNKNLIKIDAQFLAESGTHFYFDNNQLIYVSEMNAVEENFHYFKNENWFFGKRTGEVSTDTIINYDINIEKEIKEQCKIVLNSFKNMQNNQKQQTGKFIFGELHPTQGYTLEFIDKTGKSFIFRIATFDEYSKLGIELVDFDTRAASKNFENKYFEFTYSEKEGINENTGDKETVYKLISIKPSNI